jgi:polysaccharide deacetylase family protein (PEP-CTERM system associated)
MVRLNTVKNILTVDVEEAFHRNDRTLSSHQREILGGRVVEQTQRLVALLKAAGQRGTFFVLGEVAEQHPDLVKQLGGDGFELGLHGYQHRLVYEQDKETFRRETHAAKVLLEKIGGKEVIGFRAPSWSITRKSLWALRILADMGLQYDSSILPARAYLGGIRQSHPGIHRRTEAEIVEVPPSVVSIGRFRLPFSGGLYLRTLPYWFIRACIKRLNNRGLPAIIYLHPWELDTELPRLTLGWKGRYALYHNLDTVQTKVKRLLAEFSFAPVYEVLLDTHFLMQPVYGYPGPVIRDHTHHGDPGPHISSIAP